MKMNIFYCGLGSAIALTGSYPCEKSCRHLQLSVRMEFDKVFVTGTEGHVVVVRSFQLPNSWLWEWGRKYGAHEELSRHPIEMMLNYLLRAFREQISDKKDGNERDVVSWLGRCVGFVAEGLSFRSWCLSYAHSAKMAQTYFSEDVDRVRDAWREVLSKMHGLNQATYSPNSEERSQNLRELPARLDLLRNFGPSVDEFQNVDFGASTTSVLDNLPQSRRRNSSSRSEEASSTESSESSCPDVVVDWLRPPS